MGQDISYPLSERMLRQLLQDHFVGLQQDGCKVYCVFPLTDDEEKWDNKHNKARAPKASMYHEVEPDKSNPLSSRKIFFTLRNLVGPRFQRLTGFAHHLGIHFKVLRGEKTLPNVTKKLTEPLTVHFATEDEARKFANLSLLAAIAKLG